MVWTDFTVKIYWQAWRAPELSQCLRSLRKDDVLVVWKLNRVARSLKDLVENVLNLNEREIGFKSVTEAIDTTRAVGRLVFHVFGALAEHELIKRGNLSSYMMFGSPPDRHWPSASTIGQACPQ